MELFVHPFFSLSPFQNQGATVVAPHGAEPRGRLRQATGRCRDRQEGRQLLRRRPARHPERPKLGEAGEDMQVS